MSFEDFISSTDDPRPRKVVIYGTKGIGKTTLAAACPFGPCVFLPTEDGYQDIRPAQKKWTFPGKRILESEAEVHEGIAWLLANDHPFNCVIVDSISSMEVLLQKAVAEKAGKDSIADIGFKKGYDVVTSKFVTLLTGLDALLAKGIFVIVIAHATIDKFNNPEGEGYDYYTPRLDKRINPLLQEWADEVFFANSKVYTKVEEEGFGKKTAKGIDGGQRIIYTLDTATRDAKCRLELPAEIVFTKEHSDFWNLYTSAIKQPEVTAV